MFSLRPRHQSKDLSFPERDKLWIRAAFAISANEDEFHIGDDPIAKAFLLFAFHLGAQIRRFGLRSSEALLRFKTDTRTAEISLDLNPMITGYMIKNL